MSIEISNQSTLSIPHSLKVVGIIGGTWAILTIVGAVIAYLPGHPDFSPFNTYLSDICDTPGWPQIIWNSGTLIAVPIRYLVLVLLVLRLGGWVLENRSPLRPSSLDSIPPLEPH